MFFHVIVTNKCNLQCRYCFGEALDDFDEDFEENLEIDYNLPSRINYDVGLLSEFCQMDHDCVLTFYGGEPMIDIDMIKRIMDEAMPKHFMIQTNGLLLDKLEPKYVNRFHTIFVSLDGEEELTDYYRGKGTFRKVINNLKAIMQNGFRGELIARMTVMEQTDIYKQVRWLIEKDEFGFSSVHWQLNAGFWGNDFKRRKFEIWSKTSYVPGIERLAEFWVDEMEQKGIVLKLYPLLGIAHSLLHDERNSLMRCGGGWINYAIQTDGYIIPCPTMWGMKKYYLGHIRSADPLSLERVMVDRSPCVNCKILNLCGGRCLYTNITKRWKDEEYSEVCNTVERLLDVVKAKIPKIKQLIKEGKLSLENFDYMKYNGCEIIP